MSESLSFSFPVFARALAARIRKHTDNQAFIIGVSGPWGSGKTTLMDATMEDLGEENLYCKFNAWAHSKQDVVWRSFFVAVVSTLRRELDIKYPVSEGEVRIGKGLDIERLLNESEQSLYTAFTQETPGQVELDAGKLAKTGAKLALKFVPWGDSFASVTNWLLSNKNLENQSGSNDESIPLEASDVDDLLGVFKRSVVKQHVAKIESLEQFRGTMEKLLQRFATKERKLIVVVDDVDRCLPEQGLEVFEAIKLFLDLPNTVFLVAMDQGVLQHALDLRYKQNPNDARRISAELYAEKMIDLLFTIPTPTSVSFSNFVGTLPLADMLSSYAGLVGAGLPRNPRTWTRFANRAALRAEIVNDLNAEDTINVFDTADAAMAFLKLEVLWFRWPQIMRKLNSFDNYLDLEFAVFEANPDSGDFRAESSESNDVEATLASRTTKDLQSIGTIAGSLNDSELIRFLGQLPKLGDSSAELNPHLECLFTLDK